MKAFRRHTKTVDILSEGRAIDVRRISQNRLNLNLEEDILSRLDECCVGDANQNLAQTEIQDTEAHQLQSSNYKLTHS